MEHLAIDLGAKESQICVRSADGEIVEERRISTRPLQLSRYLRGRPKSRVIIETGAEAFWVAEIAGECGHEVRVVPSLLAPSLGVGRRGQKSDRRDARVLTETSCRVDLPSVHIPAKPSRELQSRLVLRDALVRSRTKLINVVKAYLRTIGERMPRRYAKTLPGELREKLPEAARKLERVLGVIDALNGSIQGCEQELKQFAARSELARRLQTVPGVGMLTALWYVATMDVASRFPNASTVGSYYGLVPSEHSSGESQRKGAITKAGCSSMRAMLVQAAWSAIRGRRYQQDPMVRWAMEVSRRRGKKVAVVALARKLSGILFALWRDGTRYEPARAARVKPLESPRRLRLQAPAA